MATLPDPDQSSAVLIGCSSYEPELEALPAVRNNLQDLAALLTDPTIGILRANRCQIVSDPTTPGDVAVALNREMQVSGDMLLIYYAGHGLLGSNGELYLGLSKTKPESLSFTALPYASLREFIRDSRAKVRVVILDCCFSGRATSEFMSSADSAIADLTSVTGTYVLASSSPSAMALARPGDPYTAFTGELIRILKEGIAGGPPLLSLSTIYQELRKTLLALGYPTPQQRDVGIAGDMCLARNAAVLSAQATASAPSTEHTDQPTGDNITAILESDGPDEVPADHDIDVEWTADEPARDDLLRRGFLADVIAMRLVETQEFNPTTSFFAHIDGPWGSGKSTFLNLVEDRVAKHFRIVHFDAWQQSRLSLPWWSLLTALRRETVGSRRPLGRMLLRFREACARVRRAGAPYLLAIILVIVVALAIGYLLWPRVIITKNWGGNVSAVVALTTALGTFSVGMLAVSRFLLWDTARGARLFEQHQENPMGDVAAHFDWLLMRSDKPVAFFVDDLDRCSKAYVVEFLDTIQTLIRGTSFRAHPNQAAYFVLAADGAWLRRSYEDTYSSFADCVGEPGRPLGYLFLDKFFQLSVPMPALAGQSQRRYLDHMLHLDSSDVAIGSESSTKRRTNGVMQQSESVIHDRLRQFAEGRSRQAVESLTNPAAQQKTEHALRKFASLLGHNPRSVKKFINTFSVLRSVRTLEENFVESETLALWALLLVRWPELADRLQAHPEAVAGITQPILCSGYFPPSLRQLASSSEVYAIVASPWGGPLTADLIRQCCGIVRE